MARVVMGTPLPPPRPPFHRMAHFGSFPTLTVTPVATKVVPTARRSPETHLIGWGHESLRLFREITVPLGREQTYSKWQAFTRLHVSL